MQNETITSQLIKQLLKLPISSQPKQTISQNSYNLCSRNYKNNENHIQCLLKTFKNIEVTPQIQTRLLQIRNIPFFDNLTPVRAKGTNKQKKQVYILYEYLQQAQSLQTTIKNKKDITQGDIKHIIYQILRALVQLQKHNFNHLRINPSSIIVKFPTQKGSKQQPIARLCDYGLGKQANYSYQSCLHPEIFANKQLNYSTRSYQEAFKYDLWALGATIYYCLKGKMPFYGKQSVFSNSQVFKQKHSKDPEAWMIKEANGINKQNLLKKLLIKCWGLYNQSTFTSWNQHYIAKDLQKTPIKQIYDNHVKLMFLFSKTYILIRKQLKYKTSKLLTNLQKQKNQKNQDLLHRLSMSILKFSYLYHVDEFNRCFKNRCSILPLEHRKILEFLTQKYYNQRQFHANSNLGQKQYTFNQIILRIPTLYAEFQVKISSYQNLSKKIIYIKNFFSQWNRLAQQAKKKIQSNQCDRSQVLNVMYESQKFKKFAQEVFGFKFRCLQQIQDQS